MSLVVHFGGSNAGALKVDIKGEGLEQSIRVYDAGTGDASVVNERIAEIWRELVSEDPREIADLLGVSESDLDPSSPLFRARNGAAGFSGGEIIIFFAGAALGGFAKTLGETAAKALVKKVENLWQERISKKIGSPSNPILGEEKSS